MTNDALHLLRVGQGPQASVTIQLVNNLGFANNTIMVITTQLSHGSMKSDKDNM